MSHLVKKSPKDLKAKSGKESSEGTVCVSMPVHLYVNLDVYAGTVAIKIATGIGSTFDAIHDPVWREAEVSGANASYLALILIVVFVQL